MFLRAQANAMSQPVFNAPVGLQFLSRPTMSFPAPRFSAGVRAAKHAPRHLHGSTTSNSLVYSTINPDQSVYGATGTQLNWSALTALAGNPPALVDKLNRLLLHGTMSPAAQSAVVTAVNAVSATDALGRAKAAFNLVANLIAISSGALTMDRREFIRRGGALSAAGLAANLDLLSLTAHAAR